MKKFTLNIVERDTMNSKRVLSEDIKNRLVYMFLFVISSLIYFRDINDFSINKIFFLGGYSLIFLLLESKDIIKVLSFTIPFLNGLPGNLILIVAVIILMCKKDMEITMTKIIFPILILCSELFHMMFYTSYFGIIVEIFRYLSFICIIGLIVYDNRIKIDYIKCLELFSIGVLIMCSIILLNTLKYYNLEELLSGTIRYGNLTRIINTTKMMLSNNENNIGYYCIMAMSSLLVLTSQSKKKFSYYLIFIGVFFYGILTMSRAFLLTSIGVIIFYRILISNSIFKVIKNIIILSIILIGMYLLVDFILPDVLHGLLDRFKDADLLNGRTDIFSVYTQFLINNPIYLLIGMGLFGTHQISGIRGVTHNGFQQIVLAYGIIGFVLFLIFLYSMCKKAYKNKVKTVNYLPLIVMIIYVQSIQLIKPYELMLGFLIAYFALQIKKDNRFG